MCQGGLCVSAKDLAGLQILAARVAEAGSPSSDVHTKPRGVRDAIGENDPQHCMHPNDCKPSCKVICTSRHG